MATIFPKPLLAALQTKECILFCGSGLSRWSGLPDWEGMLGRMLDYLSDRSLATDERTEIEAVIRQGDLLMAASICGHRMRSADMRTFFDEVFINPNPRPHEIHTLVVSLGPDSFVTTNYDRLIDDAYQSVHGGLVLIPINNDQPVEHARILKHGASRFIFAPHGRAEKINTVVLSREDYRRIQFENQSVGKALEHFFLSRPVVYLGFGLRDPDFLMLRDQIASTYQGGEREHFAILPDMSEMMQGFWRDTYGINVLSYSTNEIDVPDGHGGTCKYRRHDELLRVLRDLHQTLNGGTAGPPSGVIPPVSPPPSSHTVGKPLRRRTGRPTSRKASYVAQVKNALIRFCEDIVHRVTKENAMQVPINASFRSDLSPEQSIGIESRRRPAFDVLSSFSNVVIVGAPGAGKTHLVRTYSAQIADDALQILRKTKRPPKEALKHKIPLLLPMREYTGSLQVMIAQRIPRSVDLQTLLTSGMLTVICDAINEVPRKLVETKVATDDLSIFITKFPLCRYIITTRLMAYLPSLRFPVFELEPLRQADLGEYLSKVGTSADDLPIQLRETLENPLLLTLYLELAANQRLNITNSSSLLAATIEIMSKRFQSLRKAKVDLRTLLSPLAFDLVGRGRLTMTLEETESHLALSQNDPAQSQNGFEINGLISVGLLTVDAEGQIGFFHQTALEYLAALELLRRYKQNSGELKTHINLHRWDETIALFVSLLDEGSKHAVLRELAAADISFSCKIFEAATVRQKEVALFLFDLIVKRLGSARLPDFEKRELAVAVRKLAPYGRREILLKWLDDPEMAHAAAIHLAKQKDKSIVHRLIDLLVKDNVFPSDFGKALDILADESVVGELVAKGEAAQHDGLAAANIAEVLRRFESESLYREVDRLRHSPEASKRAFGAEILRSLRSTRAKEALVDLLADRSHDVRWKALFGLRGFWHHQGYKTSGTVAKVFKLLSDEKVGHWAADYLIVNIDQQILNEAERRFLLSKNELEKINLSAILILKNPDQMHSFLFEKLRSFKPAHHEPLYSALARLPVNKLLPGLFAFLRKDNLKLRETVLKALSWLRTRSEELPISKEDCAFLFSLWEKEPKLYERVGFLLADNFRAVSKPLWLCRLNDPTYPSRSQLIEWVSRMPLTKEDLKPEIIEWLLTKFDTVDRFAGMNSVGKIVGQVLDESAVYEKLIPLLTSMNPAIRSNAYAAVRTAERTLGKRLTRPIAGLNVAGTKNTDNSDE